MSPELWQSIKAQVDSLIKKGGYCLRFDHCFLRVAYDMAHEQMWTRYYSPKSGAGKDLFSEDKGLRVLRLLELYDKDPLLLEAHNQVSKHYRKKGNLSIKEEDIPGLFEELDELFCKYWPLANQGYYALYSSSKNLLFLYQNYEEGLKFSQKFQLTLQFYPKTDLIRVGRNQVSIRDLQGSVPAIETMFSSLG